MGTGSPAYMAGAQCVLLSVSAKESHLPLKVFVELLAETVMLAQFSSLFRGFVALSAGAEGVSMGEWESCLL